MTTQQLSETARKNLESNKELWTSESKYIKLEAGETVVLQFNPEKIKHVEGQYGPRVQYTVINPNYSTKEKKSLKPVKRHQVK